MSEDEDDDRDENHCAENRSYCPEFFAFLESYLPETPLWSGVLLGSLDRYICYSPSEYDNLDDYPYLSFKSANARTEGYIEGMMRNLKQEDFLGRRRLRPDTFVFENYPRIIRRLTDFSDRFVSKKTKKRKKRAKEINDESASVEHVNNNNNNNNNTNDSHESKTGKGECSCEEPKKVSKKLYKGKKIDNDRFSKASTTYSC